MDSKALLVIAVVVVLLLPSALGKNEILEKGVSKTAYTYRDKISTALFGKGNEGIDNKQCHWWFGLSTAPPERADYIQVVCGQIICPSNTYDRLGGSNEFSGITIDCGGQTKDKVEFYVLYGFLPFVVLMYIFRDMMLLFSFLTPRTSNLISLCLAAYGVFLSHGIFNVVMGLMNFLGGPGSSFDFTQLFFSVLFFSMIFGFVFDSIFRMVIETSRVSKAIQYQMYEIAAETQLGKWRAGT